MYRFSGVAIILHHDYITAIYYIMITSLLFEYHTTKYTLLHCNGMLFFHQMFSPQTIWASGYLVRGKMVYYMTMYWLYIAVV